MADTVVICVMSFVAGEGGREEGNSRFAQVHQLTHVDILGSGGNPSVNDNSSFSPRTAKSHVLEGGVALVPSGEMFRDSFLG